MPRFQRRQVLSRSCSGGGAAELQGLHEGLETAVMVDPTTGWRKAILLSTTVAILALFSGCDSNIQSEVIAEVTGYKGDRICVIAERPLFRHNKQPISGCYAMDAPLKDLQLGPGQCAQFGLAYLGKWPDHPASFLESLDRDCDIPRVEVECVWRNQQSSVLHTGVPRLADGTRPPSCAPSN